MLSSPSVFSPGDCHMFFITFPYHRDIQTPSLSCTIIMTNLAWEALRFILFLRALIGILSVTLLLPGSLDIASAWAMIRPPLYLMVNSYCWSFVSYRALHPLGRSAVLPVSSATWSVMILKGFISKYCQNFSIPHTMVKYSFSIMG